MSEETAGTVDELSKKDELKVLLGQVSDALAKPDDLNATELLVKLGKANELVDELVNLNELVAVQEDLDELKDACAVICDAAACEEVEDEEEA